MAAQAQVKRVRVETALVAQVGLIEWTNMVVDQASRNDQRYICETIGLNHLQQFLLFIR